MGIRKERRKWYGKGVEDRSIFLSNFNFNLFMQN